MSSLFVIAAILLHHCHLSASFSALSKISSRPFFARQFLRHDDTSLSSTALYSTAAINHLDDSNMRQLLFSPPSDAPSAVLVDAYTQWCGPCKLIEPLITSIATKHSKHLSCLKYDVEDSNSSNLKLELLLQGVRVSGLPTLILYWNGKHVASHSGMISKEELEEWLEVNLFSNESLERGVDGGGREVKKKKRGEVDGRDGGGGVVVAKRGFVSFASQYGKDDYAL